MYLHWEILRQNYSGAGLGCHPKEDYVAAGNDATKKALIDQQRLRNKMINWWIRN